MWEYCYKSLIVVCLLLAPLVVARWNSAAVGGQSGSGTKKRPASRSDNAYSPVASARAIHVALAANLKIVGDWIEDGDFGSAQQSAEGALVLAAVFQFQSSQSQWRAQTREFHGQCRALFESSRTKDSERCAAALKACEETLDKLKDRLPRDAKATVKDFRPPANLRTLMLLLDGTYSDAKYAGSIDDMAMLAAAVAEVCNITKHLRPDERWRRLSIAVQQSALAASRHAEASDEDSARLELKATYKHCEACHETYRR